jgi:hypothetical protein
MVLTHENLGLHEAGDSGDQVAGFEQFPGRDIRVFSSELLAVYPHPNDWHAVFMDKGSNVPEQRIPTRLIPNVARELAASVKYVFGVQKLRLLCAERNGAGKQFVEFIRQNSPLSIGMDDNAGHDQKRIVLDVPDAGFIHVEDTHPLTPLQLGTAEGPKTAHG